MAQSGKLSATDRLACALVSAVLALVTASILSLVLLLRAEAWATYFWSHAFPLVVILVCAAAIAGFSLGPERMANVFGIVWGTGEANAWQTFIVVAIVLAACFWLMR
jgi:hypothetical protein